MKKVTAATAVIIILALIVSVVWYISQPVPVPVTQVSITIGMLPFEHAALVFIAKDRDYFSDAGLNVTIRPYGSGAAGINGMRNGEVDLVLSSEYPIVTSAFGREPISVIATIDRYQAGYLVAREDRGISNLSDLRGKRIGAELGTMSEFRLSRYLELNGISQDDTTLVNVPMPRSADSIVNGTVDAIIVIGNEVDPISRGLGGKIVSWRVESNQLGYSLLVGRNEWIAGHHSEIQRLLGSLVLAEGYAASNPAESREIVRKRLNMTPEYIEKAWPEHQFRLSLDQSLILSMEDESRWMVNNRLTNQTTIPNFLDYLAPGDLARVKPGSVDITR